MHTNMGKNNDMMWSQMLFQLLCFRFIFVPVAIWFLQIALIVSWRITSTNPLKLNPSWLVRSHTHNIYPQVRVEWRIFIASSSSLPRPLGHFVCTCNKRFSITFSSPWQAVARSLAAWRWNWLSCNFCYFGLKKTTSLMCNNPNHAAQHVNTMLLSKETFGLGGQMLKVNEFFGSKALDGLNLVYRNQLG